jgi:hypothetical protein
MASATRCCRRQTGALLRALALAPGLWPPGWLVAAAVAVEPGRVAVLAPALMLRTSSHVCRRRVYLPMFGFNECLNVSIATGLVLQHLLHLCPEARGDLSDARRCARRAGCPALPCPAAAAAAAVCRCGSSASCSPAGQST